MFVSLFLVLDFILWNIQIFLWKKRKIDLKDFLSFQQCLETFYVPFQLPWRFFFVKMGPKFWIKNFFLQILNKLKKSILIQNRFVLIIIYNGIEALGLYSPAFKLNLLLWNWTYVYWSSYTMALMHSVLGLYSPALISICSIWHIQVH